MRVAGPPTSGTRFDQAAKIADAVLYEGYVLYPYRASALKNRFRWQFGSVVPRACSESLDVGPWWMQTECLVQAGDRATVTIKARFLQLQLRTIEEPPAAPDGPWVRTERVLVDEREHLSWEEGVLREVTEGDLGLENLLTAHTFAYELPAGRDVEVVRDAANVVKARVVRERAAVQFSMRVSACPCDGLVKLAIRFENTTEPKPNADVSRDAALRCSLVSCHALLGVDDGAFVSLLDPPDSATAVARDCNNQHLWPVLVGVPGARDVMLAAPIILYDYPAVAPESGGDFFDATEIDELLTLRVLTLTDAEKAEAAATDERARRIVQRVERSVPNDVERLHGAMRPFDMATDRHSDQAAWESMLNPPNAPRPEDASTIVGSVQVRRGSRVRLAPRQRADSMDMFLVGRTATVTAVHSDLEDRTFVAVTLEDDPAADLREEVGRYFHFLPEELEPISRDEDCESA